MKKNNFKITYNFLKNLFFDDLEILKNSNILEIGWFWKIHRIFL